MAIGLDANEIRNVVEIIAENKQTQNTKLDISNCGLTQLPDDLFLDMEYLEELNVSHNQIRDIKRLKKLVNLKVLDLSHNGISNIYALRYLTDLTFLSLNNTAIINIKSLENLIQLEILDISYNKTNDLAPISKLSKLKSLNISQLIISDLKPINTLTQLNVLESDRNKITDLSVISDLVSLEVLALGFNAIQDISALSNFKSLRTLFLSNNEISNIFPLHDLHNLERLDIEFNQINDISALENLTNLRALYCGRNKISDISPLSNLLNLSALYIESNKITKIDIIRQLVELVDFGANGNKIENIDSLKMLKKLIFLSISYNSIETTIDVIEEILENNPLLNELYLDVNTAGIPPGLENNVQELRAYLKKEKASQKTVKIILVGNTRSGKTQFLNYLTSNNFNDKSETTHGIKIKNWKYIIAGDEYNIVFHDFGGQDYYHATHNIYLDSNALYLVFWHPHSVQPQKDKHQHLGLEYWLGNIDYFIDAQKEKNATIWTIQSRSDDDGSGQGIAQQRQFIKTDMIDLYKVDSKGQYFLSIKETAKKNIKWEMEWIYFQYHLEEKIKEIAINNALTREIIDVRDIVLPQLREQKYLIIEKEEFIEKCNDILKLQNNTDYTSALLYLKKSGQIIWYDNYDNLEYYIFPNPNALSDMIFGVLNNEDLEKSKGEFSDVSLYNYLQKTDYKNQGLIRQVFVSLLERYQIIFRKPISETDTYVVPQYLPDQKLDKHLRNLIPVSLVIQYQDYMPFWKISNFIAHKSKYFTGSENYWRYGMLYEEEGCTIFIKVQRPLIDTDEREQKIYIHISGPENKRKNLLLAMFTDFACINIINKDNNEDNGIIREDNFIKRIQLSENNEDFFAIRELLDGMEKKERNIKSVNGKYKKIPKVFYPLLGRQDFNPKKIFFSYSHVDSKYRDELDGHFSALKRNELVETWYDLDIQPGDNWDDRIMEEIKKADIILGLISSDFMKSSYIWNREVPQLKEKVFIPIFLRPCDFEGSFFDMKQGVPFDSRQSGAEEKSGIKWIISSHVPYRDEAYIQVVDKIKYLLNWRDYEKW